MKFTLFAPALILLLAGCAQNTMQPIKKPAIIKPAPVQPSVVQKPTPKPTISKPMPKPPKKNIKLKEIDDTNFNPEYMYPKDKKPSTPVATSAPTVTPVVATNASPTTVAMSKEECVSMITQEKFDKYTTMYGGEAATLKRCSMLKAMQ